ncbi:hypothetical protein HNP84_009053 [Thermocatellispora tengchongensis]|uniref:Uncharacterized protein n=1 Tax=Thermocatellispora tengchongensis TaxID=1073253 RepID=A0A840PNL3_9ACTN|nr:LxmA leader domain family RiPP [Thermocatellispora tengchongensis]MBB5139290.1 hypothetical protein [Thermocatellispora tengchongensis]
MKKSAAITELVAGYDAYTDVQELNISAAAGAPATSWICVSAVSAMKSSNACKAASGVVVSFVSGVTYEVAC